jgi:primary-amine oxidase
VLSDVYYTPADGPPLRVLSSARLSQLHVAYDDSDVTYNDVTQYGLGGSYLVTLTQTDCPQGTLLTVQTRAVLCVWRTSADNRYRTPTRAASSQSLNLFSVSQVGAYTYITSWIFYDDGAIEPGIGATGALQRSSADLELPFGRVLQGDPDTLWLSHTHSYYWRLDFDLGASATDDVVSELRYQRNTQGRRELQTTVFTTEQARRIEPDTHQMWRISEHAAADAAAYDIEPTRHGHRFERKEVEPYTDYDFFVTVGKDCERFASQNSRFNPECQNHVLEYVDGQPLQNEDLIVWHRVSFHHVPRSEDQRHMHTHWDGFKMRPANVHTATSGLANIANTVPVFSEISDRRNRPGDHVHVTLNATDSDGDVLSYTASGLPDGLSIDINGLLHGETKLAGVYRVTVKAQDDHSAGSASFVWVVDASGSDNGAVKTGAFNVWFALLGVLFLILRRRPQAPHRCASALPPLRSLHHRQFF